MVIVIFGLVGSGKSTVAKALAERLNAEVLNSDVIRKRLAGIDPYESARDSFSGGIYSKDFTDRVYRTMIDEAVNIASEGKRPVILDATFREKKYRKLLEKRAGERGVKVLFFFLDASEDKIRERLEKRSRERTVSDADWDIYLKMRESFDPPENAHIIDADGSVEEVVGEIIKVLEGTDGLR